MKIFSSGGGVQSTAILVLSAQGKVDYPIHIFANVGKNAESPHTIAYVNEVIKPFALANGIEWREVCRRDRSGNPIDLYDALVESDTSIQIPVKMGGSGAPGNRNCTQNWKVKVVSSELLKIARSGNTKISALIRNQKLRLRCEIIIREKIGYSFDLPAKFTDDQITPQIKAKIKDLRFTDPLILTERQAVEKLLFNIKKRLYCLYSPVILGKGISIDEISRARSDSGYAHYSVDYPLIDLELSRQDCLRIVKDAGLPDPPKSSCWFCPFKTLKQWQQMKRLEPIQFDKSVKLERILSDRALKLGRGRMYFTSKGASKNSFLDEVTSDQIDLSNSANLDFCESGFCMT